MLQNVISLISQSRLQESLHVYVAIAQSLPLEPQFKMTLVFFEVDDTIDVFSVLETKKF